jgi:hypothetical protein
MNKRGQFYLIAAIIIIGIVLTSVVTVNYIKTKKEKYPIYNIRDIVDLETAAVLRFGTVSGGELDDLMKTWVQDYATYGGQSILGDWIFVYGTKDSSGEIKLKALVINEKSSGGLDLGFGDTTVSSPQFDPYTVIVYDISTDVNLETGEIEVSIPEMNYTNSFDVKQGQNFWFVITTGNQTISN